MANSPLWMLSYMFSDRICNGNSYARMHAHALTLTHTLTQNTSYNIYEYDKL